MPLDPTKIAEWKREGPACVSDPVSTWTETIAPLIAEVERLLDERVSYAQRDWARFSEGMKRVRQDLRERTAPRR